MFDLINGLPVHPLVVHAVVVFVPLTVIGTLLIAFSPRLRARYGSLVLLFAIVSVVLIPVATSSGEALEKRVGDPGEHATLGDQMIWFAIPLLVLVAVLVFLDRQGRGGWRSPDATGTTARTSVLTVVGALAVIAALASAVQVYRVGDSGAHAVWGDQVSAQSSGGSGDGGNG